MPFKFNPFTGTLDRVEKSSTPPFSYCQVRNTDTTTAINTATATAIPFGGTVDKSDADYTLTADSITCNFNGVVNVQAHISQTGNVQRSNVRVAVTKNGTVVSGKGLSGYIRSAGGHNESSSHITTTFDVVEGDIIRVTGQQEGTGGSVVQIAGNSQVTVERRL